MEAFKTYRLEAVENLILVGPIGGLPLGSVLTFDTELIIRVGLPKEDPLAKGRFCNH
jgi:hypothetical protein